MQMLRLFVYFIVVLGGSSSFAQNKGKAEARGSVLLLVTYQFSQDANFSSWANPALLQNNSEAFKNAVLIANHFEEDLERSFRQSSVSLISPRRQGFETLLPFKFKTTNLTQGQLKELMNFFGVNEVLMGRFEVQKSPEGLSLQMDLNLQRGLKLESVARINKEQVLKGETLNAEILLENKQYLENLSLAGKIVDELEVKNKSRYSYNLKLVGNYTRSRREVFREALKEHFGANCLVKELVVTASDVVFTVDSPMLENEFKKRLKLFSFQGRNLKDVQAEAEDWVLLF